VSQYRAPLSPNQMCERVWTLPLIPRCFFIDLKAPARPGLSLYSLCIVRHRTRRQAVLFFCKSRGGHDAPHPLRRDKSRPVDSTAADRGAHLQQQQSVQWQSSSFRGARAAGRAHAPHRRSGPWATPIIANPIVREMIFRKYKINTDEVSSAHRCLIPSFATGQGQRAASANRHPPHQNQRHRRPGDLTQREDDSV
jgi:hypothetical protein